MNVTLNKKWRGQPSNENSYDNFITEFEKLECKRHPLNNLETNYYIPIIKSIYRAKRKHYKGYNNEFVLNKNAVYISHTSNSILQNPDTLRSVRTCISLKLTDISEKNKLIIKNIVQSMDEYSHIRAKESLASFGLQKGNLVGLNLKLHGYRFYDYIYNIRLNKKEILKIISECNPIEKLLDFEEVDKEYDLVVRGHPILEDLGCRIGIKFARQLREERKEGNKIALKVFNLYDKI